MESDSKKLAYYTLGVNLTGLLFGAAVFMISNLVFAAFGFLTGIIAASFLVYRKEENTRRRKTGTAELFHQAASKKKKQRYRNNGHH